MEMDLPTIYEVCHHQQFCYSNTTEIDLPKGYESCCQACSCDHDCYAVGNCCPDARLPDPAKLSLPPLCINSWLLLNKYRIDTSRYNPKSNPESFGFYHFIDSCPITTNASENVIQMCRQPLEINDLTPVSSIDGDKLYRNRHCATCNNEGRYVLWRTYTNCISLFELQFTNTAEADEYIFKNCPVNLLPPNYMYEKKVLCVPDNEVISKCNQTGMWKKYDPYLVDACTNQLDQYKAHYRGAVKHSGQKTFRNIYCYMCNVQTLDTKYSDMCLQRSKMPDIDFNSGVSLVLVLNYKEDHHYPDIDEEKGCDKSTDGQIYDPFMKRCRQVICRRGMIMVYGQCKTIATGIGIGVNMLFKISNKTYMSTDYVNKEIDVILPALKKRLREGILPNCDAGLCRRSFIDEFSVVHATMYSISSCPFDKMLKAIQKIKGKPITINASKTITFDLMLHLNNVTYGHGIHLMTDNTLSRCDSYVNLDDDLLEDCPRFNLSMTEIQTYPSSKKYIQKLMEKRLRRAVDNTDSLTICVEDYMTIFSRASCLNCQTGFLMKRLLVAMAMLILFK